MEHRLGIFTLESNESALVAQVQCEVEQALPFFGMYGEESLQLVRGKLSTNPNLSQVTYDMQENKCHKYSEELRRCLALFGIPSILSFSGNSEYMYHEYLLRYINGFEILIDPTIGQFVRGYNHIFVGTRTELRDLVLYNSDSENFFYRDTYSPLSRRRSFTRNWGDFPQPVLSP